MTVDKGGEESRSKLLNIHLKALGAEAKKRREAEENSRSFCLYQTSLCDRLDWSSTSFKLQSTIIPIFRAWT
jgi:hypothetical protein